MGKIHRFFYKLLFSSKNAIPKKMEFLYKQQTLQQMNIPVLFELEKAEKEGRMKNGTLQEFLKGLDKVKRWTKGEGIFQDRDNGKAYETDLDHVIKMEEMAGFIFDTDIYTSLRNKFDSKKVKDGILVHDGGEIGVGDTTHADEEYWKKTKTERKANEQLSFTNFFRLRTSLNGLGEKLATDLYQSYFNEEFELSLEGQMVVFLDHLQAVTYGLLHLYPYEPTYTTPQALEYYVSTYLIKPFEELSLQLSEEAKKELLHFVSHFVEKRKIQKSYQIAIRNKRLSPELGRALLKKIDVVLQRFW